MEFLMKLNIHPDLTYPKCMYHTNITNLSQVCYNKVIKLKVKNLTTKL